MPALMLDHYRKRAADSGTQTIRLIFDEPQKLRRISLLFEEGEIELPKSSYCDGLQMAGARFEKSCVSGGISAHPTRYGGSRNIGLNSDVTVLEVVIVPDTSRGAARASLKSLRMS